MGKENKSSSRAFFYGILTYGLGMLGSKLISFILLPFNTARLTPSEYGITDMVSVITSLVMPFATLEMGVSMYKKLIGESDTKQIKEIISNGILCVLFSSFVVAVLVIPISRSLDVNFILIVFFLVFFGGINSTLLYLVRGLNNDKIYAITGCISTVVVSLANIFLLLYTDLRSEAILLSSICSNIVTIVFMGCAIKIWRYISIKSLKRERVRELVRFGVPLIPRDICWWVDNSFSRIVLNRTNGNAENGYLVVSQKFSNLYGNLFGIVSLSWNDTSIKGFNKEGYEHVVDLFFKEMFRLMACSYIILLPLISLCFGIFVDSAYASALQYVPLLLLAMVINQFADLYVPIFMSLGKSGLISSSALVSTACAATFSVFLIPTYGIFGIGFSLLFSNLIMLIFRIVFIRRNTSIKFPISQLWLIMLILLYLCSFYLIPHLQLYFLLFAVVVFCILNWHLVRLVGSRILRKGNFHE